jgi:YVTN family beta-propeller protein
MSVSVILRRPMRLAILGGVLQLLASAALAGPVVYVSNKHSKDVTVIDVEKLEVVAAIDLGGPREITRARFGERVFHSARNCFHRQFSCHSCHPDGHVDGLTYNLEASGIGFDPVDNLTLRGIVDTAPFKWIGLNPSLRRQCGARLAVFFTRLFAVLPGAQPTCQGHDRGGEGEERPPGGEDGEDEGFFRGGGDPAGQSLEKERVARRRGEE